MTTLEDGKMKDTGKAALQKEIAFYSNLLAQHEKRLKASKELPEPKHASLANDIHILKVGDGKTSGITKSKQLYPSNVKSLSKNLTNVMLQNSTDVPIVNYHRRTVLINQIKSPISKASILPSNNLHVKPYIKKNNLSWTSSQKSIYDYRKSSVYNTSIVKGTSSNCLNVPKLQYQGNLKKYHNASFNLTKSSVKSVKNVQPSEKSVSFEKSADTQLLVGEILAITQKMKQTSKTLSPSKMSSQSSLSKMCSLLSSKQTSLLSSKQTSSLLSSKQTSSLSSITKEKPIRVINTMCNQSLKPNVKLNFSNRSEANIVRTLDNIPIASKLISKDNLPTALLVASTPELALERRPNLQSISVENKSTIMSTNQSLFLLNKNKKQNFMLSKQTKIDLNQKDQTTNVLNHKLPCLMKKTLERPITVTKPMKRLSLQLVSVPVRKTTKNICVSAKKKNSVTKVATSKYQVVNKKCQFNNAVTFKINDPSLLSICKSDYKSRKWMCQKGFQQKLLMSKQKQLNSKYKVINEMLGSGNKLKLNNPSKLSVRSPKGDKYKILKKKLSFDMQKNNSSKIMDKTILSSNSNAVIHKPLTKLSPKTNKTTFNRNVGILNKNSSLNRNLKSPSVKKPKRCSLNSSSKSKYKFVNQSSISIMPSIQNKVSKKLIPSSSKLHNFLKSDIDVDLLLELAAEKGSKNSGITEPLARNKRVLMKRVYKSKNAIINKNVHSVQVKTAKMIKSKYFPVNKRHSWQKQAVNKFASHKHFQGRLNKNFPARMGSASFYNQRNIRNRSKLKVTNFANTTYCLRSNSKRLLFSQNKNFPGSTKGNKFLRRTSTNHRVLMKISPNVIRQSTPVSKILASRVLQHSISRVLTASLKKKMSKVNTYCMFYNRFGRCNKGTKCPYVHDPSKIAICTRFLRGTCKVENCTFSHEICPGKMAICSFFLSGSCTKTDCPYRHEMLTPSSDLCKAFVQGYCPNGKQCKKAHVLVCPQYVQGFCSKGDECAFPHPPPKEKKLISSKAGEKSEHPCDTDEFLIEKVSRYFQPLTEKLVLEKTETSNSSVVPKRKKNLPEQPSFISLSLNDSEL